MQPSWGQTHGENNTSFYSVLPHPKIRIGCPPQLFLDLLPLRPARRLLSSCSHPGDMPQAQTTPTSIQFFRIQRLQHVEHLAVSPNASWFTSLAGDCRRAAISGTDPQRERHQHGFSSIASEDQNRPNTTPFPRAPPVSPRPRAFLVMQPFWGQTRSGNATSFPALTL